MTAPLTATSIDPDIDPADLDLASTIIREARMYGDKARELIVRRINIVRIEAETAGMQSAYGDLNEIIDRYLARCAS